MEFLPPAPPWAAARPSLLDDENAKLVHAVALELQGRGYETLHELPDAAGDLPPQVVAGGPGGLVLNFRMNCEQEGMKIASWELLVGRPGRLGWRDERRASLNAGAANREARNVVSQGLYALGLAACRSRYSY
ncbi:hypothetical protein [Streptomyces sp. NPDC055099]